MKLVENVKKNAVCLRELEIHLGKFDNVKKLVYEK